MKTTPLPTRFMSRPPSPLYAGVEAHVLILQPLQLLLLFAAGGVEQLLIAAQAVVHRACGIGAALLDVGTELLRVRFACLPPRIHTQCLLSALSATYTVLRVRFACLPPGRTPTAISQVCGVVDS